MRPIRYADRTVALCAGDDVLLAPEIAALEPDHPTRRFVSMLCVFSAEVDGGAAPDGACGYSLAAAERYARRELMPGDGLQTRRIRPGPLARGQRTPPGRPGPRRREVRERQTRRTTRRIRR
jgi:hypothetical protein